MTRDTAEVKTQPERETTLHRSEQSQAYIRSLTVSVCSAGAFIKGSARHNASKSPWNEASRSVKWGRSRGSESVKRHVAAGSS